VSVNEWVYFVSKCVYFILWVSEWMRVCVRVSVFELNVCVSEWVCVCDCVYVWEFEWLCVCPRLTLFDMQIRSVSSYHLTHFRKQKWKRAFNMKKEEAR